MDGKHVVHLVTKNRTKLLAASSVFGRYGIEVKSLPYDEPEIQAMTSIEVARHTAIAAAKAAGVPAIREDHGLYINALGIPGPFTHYIEEMLPVERLARIVANLDDRTGYFELSAAYAAPSGACKEYSYRVPILFSAEPKGEPSRKWDRIMMLEGETRTFAEYDEAERTEVWSRNYESIARDIVGGKMPA